MNGQFRLAQDVETQDVGIATLRWICHPASTAARQMTVAEATFAPGRGHSFHMHPDQEETIYVVSGRIEQWVGEERRILSLPATPHPCRLVRCTPRSMPATAGRGCSPSSDRPSATASTRSKRRKKRPGTHSA